MCLLSLFSDYLQRHTDSENTFGVVIWVLNILLLLLFMIELRFLRNVKWCRLPHAYIAVILSMISSIISSTFFLISQHNQYLSITCSFGPIIAISFRTMSKTFTWGLYIIRGQMVVEALHSLWISKIATTAHYFLAIQCIIINAFIILFTDSTTDGKPNTSMHCVVTYPLWLLLSSAVIGELLYGFGFMYIFLKAMTTTMKHVFNSMQISDVESTKQQLRHHIIIYMIQTFSSITFLIIVSTCICFETLVFFEAELFISNLCLLMLFREKKLLIKKACRKCCVTDEANLVRYARNRSLTSLKNLKHEVRSNLFLSDKWRSKKEVTQIKHEIQASITMAKYPAISTCDIQMTECSNLPPKLKLTNDDTFIVKSMGSDITAPLSAPVQPTSTNEEFHSRFSNMTVHSLSSTIGDNKNASQQPVQTDYIFTKPKLRPNHQNSLSTTHILTKKSGNCKPKKSIILQMADIIDKFKTDVLKVPKIDVDTETKCNGPFEFTEDNIEVALTAPIDHRHFEQSYAM